MKNRPVLLALTVFLTVLMLQGCQARESESVPPETKDLVEKFHLAQEVLARAAEAYGGKASVFGLNVIKFSLSGPISQATQNYSAKTIDNPEVDGVYEVLATFDYSSDRFFQETRQQLKGGFDLDFGSIYDAGTFYSLQYNSNEFQKVEGPETAFSKRGLLLPNERFIPQLMLKYALKNFRSSYWVGEETFDGVEADVVEATWDENLRFRLVVAKDSGRILRFEALSPDSQTSEAVSAYDYLGAREVSGYVFPDRVRVSRNGVPVLDMKMQAVRVNEPIDPATFLPPQNFNETESPDIVVTELGSGFYEISGISGGLYRSQFVDMGDFVIVFEAPLGYPISNMVIAKIREALGDKPIKYVVSSHFHSDHAGGVGAFAEIGAVVLTSSENVEVLNRYARSRPRIFGLGPAPADLTLKTEIISGQKEILGSGDRRVTIFEIKNTPHVAEMLVMFDHRTGIMANGDMYSKIVKFNQTFLAFSEWLEESGLEVNLITGTHHKPTTSETIATEAAKYLENTD